MIKYFGMAMALAQIALFADSTTQNQPTTQDMSLCTPVVMASPDYCFEVNFAALILRPFANNLDYYAEALPFNYGDAQPAVSPSWQIGEISPDFHFGFDLGIATVFHDAHSTLMLNWERYHTSTDSASFTVPSTNYMVGPFFEIGPDASSYKKVKGKNYFHFDQVNLDYGLFADFGDLRMNFFSGVGFARLHQHLKATFSDIPGTIVRTIEVPAKFIGAGPQLGVDFAYTIVKGFQLVGSSQGTLFVGTFRNKTTYSTTSNDLVVLGDQNPNIQTTKVHKKGGIVPGFEGKLGLAYEATFRCHYMFKIEAGYQAQVYLDAIRSVDMGSEVALAAAGSVGSSTVGVYARTFERTVSDFGLGGPYAAISLGF